MDVYLPIYHFHLSTGDPWATQGLGDQPPHSWKSAYNFWLPQNLAIHWYLWEIGSRTLCRYQTLWMLKPLCNKGKINAYNRSSASVDPLNHRSKSVQVFIENKSMSKWAHAVYTCVVQGSTVYEQVKMNVLPSVMWFWFYCPQRGW